MARPRLRAVHPEGRWYHGLTPEAARRIVLSHLKSARLVEVPAGDQAPACRPSALARQAQEAQQQ